MTTLTISSKKKQDPLPERVSKIPMVTHPETNRLAKCLFFGPSGHGKTYLLGTAQNDPRTYPMLLLDYEGGTSTLDGWNPQIDIVKIRTWSDFDDAYHWLKSGKHPYNSVGLDSVSESHVFALLNQLESSTRNRSIPDLLEQGDYGIALVQMRKILRKFRDLPLHVFASCMAKDEDDPREGRVKKPALAGALADEAPGIFEMVAYLALGESQDEDGNLVTTRYLLLQNQAKIRTKVRMPYGVIAPSYLENPTITSILNLLRIDTTPQTYNSKEEEVETPQEKEVEEVETPQEEKEEETPQEETQQEEKSKTKLPKTMTISTRKN